MNKVMLVGLVQMAIVFLALFIQVSGIEHAQKINDVLFAALVALVPVFVYYETPRQYQRTREAILYGSVLLGALAVWNLISRYFGQ